MSAWSAVRVLVSSNKLLEVRWLSIEMGHDIVAGVARDEVGVVNICGALPPWVLSIHGWQEPPSNISRMPNVLLNKLDIRSSATVHGQDTRHILRQLDPHRYQFSSTIILLP